MMRSRLAARSARLVLAAAAVTALAATATACNADDVADAGSSASAAASSAGSENPSTSGSGSSDSSTDAPKSNGSSTSSPKSNGSNDESGSGSGSGSGEKSGYGQSCGTNDLDFTVSSQSQAGGYYLVTVKAKSGITCYLDSNTPSVSFGSGADGVASPVGQGGEDPIKLTGSSAAYAGISPSTTNSNNGKQFDNVIIAVTNDDPDPAELKLPDTAGVDKPIVTNWGTNSAEAVPAIA